MSSSNEPHFIPPLGLVAGGPMSVDLNIVQATDGSSVVLLRIETGSGSFCQPLTPEYAVLLGEKLIERGQDARKPQIIAAKPNLFVPPGSNGKHRLS